ncbi:MULTISPECIES: histidine utilization repressor [unclassified Pseudomonas]|uniref:histidine utilization repressor n=1 Tax=unclassified Pseudomonas TaxID=196821 RepID=UPI000BD2820A|nr:MULTISPECIES: histidine utilization repressor [unclassified Pseudomonas]PVZ20661.1 GntR family histidine utilization transcriptional repressor [Pseudomonas sp. URIL14HWK12:I12]PVZ27727.1 GntR family histidine utilization transcriptional repressor [Pseudomonas sp. URIL14HWK12:I10]PVZ38616.1 GntR family histidine utilization transcriptional repressor [Pseudomonas sp. URIL14HWK12:I11]SNZ02648.1 transcriptional regulator, GntR family [Pseudomonas sp. URIL14HWK12:I9]
MPSSPISSPPPNGAPAPFYEQVKQLILSQIHSGAWPPHQKIPSEAELVAQLGFSRMTVHRALRELTSDGLLVRMQGVGTFVAEPKGQAALFEVHNIADEIASRGHEHRLEVIWLKNETANGEQSVALGVREGQPVFHSLIVHFENDVPVQIEDRYVNPAVAPHYLEQDFTLETPYLYLNRLAPLTEGEHVVEAVLPTREEQQLLDIPAQEPCLMIRRRTWSGRRAVTSARLLYPGSRYRLEGHFGS